MVCSECSGDALVMGGGVFGGGCGLRLECGLSKLSLRHASHRNGVLSYH